MTPLVLAALAFSLAVSLYLAALAGRRSDAAATFLDGGARLPAWAPMFAGAGVLGASLGLQDHLLLTTLYGLQASHVALGLALAALCGAMAHKRLWIAARALGACSPIEILSVYYGGVALRVALMAITLTLALPFAAHALAQAGDLVAAATEGRIGREPAIAAIAFALLLVSLLGGWRGAAWVVAAQSFAMLALLLFLPLFMAGAFGKLAFLNSGPSALKGVLADQIPGVLQYSAGVGKDVAVGGPFTCLTILGAGASLIGVSLSPAMGLVATTARLRTGLAFGQTWLIAGLATGALLMAAPLLAAEIAAAGAPRLDALAARLGEVDYLAAVALLVLLLASTQIVVTFFVTAAGSLIVGDVVHRYLLPDLPDAGRRLAARIALSLLYAAVATIAVFAPLSATILGAAALPLSAQLLPAFIGLCWAPWISRPSWWSKLR